MAEQRGNHSSSPEIGEKLRSFRKSKGMSIRVLAEKAGVSPNTISLIESSSTSPTVATLQALANVLDVPLSAFFTHDEQDEEVILIKAREHSEEVAKGLNVGVFPTTILNQRVRVMNIAIAPGMESGSEPLIHPGDELVVCLQGELEYVVQDRIYRLAKEDCLAFKANLPHSWRNRSRSETRFLVLITTETDQSFRSHILPVE
jgi:transcriptional regulator with XRE-family HTH domain